MPRPLFLHIQSRGRSPTRVIPLSDPTVRVGRAADCEARLEDPSLAEVECLLRLQGETWYIQPLPGRGRITIDGRPVTHLRALAANVALRIGEFSLIVRDRDHAAPAFGAIEVPTSPNLPPLPRYSTLLEDDLLRDRDLDAPRRAAAPPRPSISVPILAPGLNRVPTPPDRDAATRVWEARWRAAARSLRAHSRSAVPKDAAEPDAAGTPTVPFTPRVAPPQPDLSDEAAERASGSPPAEVVRETDPNPAGLPEPPNSPRAGAEVGGVSPPSSPEAVGSGGTETGPPIAPKAASTESLVDPARGPERTGAVAGTLPESREARRESRGATLMNAMPPTPARPASARRGAPQPAPPAPQQVENEDEEWPSARSILAARPVGDPTRPTPRRAKTRGPVPTASVAPPQWSPAPRLAWTVSLAATLLLGAAGVYFSAHWAADDREAGVLADRLLKPTSGPIEPIAEEEISPDATWWKTTGPHLALRVAALGTVRGGSSRQETTRFLLDAARAASPLEPSSRLARADLSGDDAADALAPLGLSRDALSMALTARVLARRGKTGPALAAYRSALSFAAQSNPSRGRVPIYLEEPTARRFALPSETLALGIVREMAAQPAWTPETWSGALPDHALILLTSYRILKERGAPEAEAALERLIDSGESPALGDPAVHAAARAEGLALAGRAQEAAALYETAIPQMRHPAVKRSWHLNRGVILARGGDTERANDALDAMMAARAGRGDDEIGKRVAQAMAREGMAPKGAAATPASRARSFRAN